MIVDQPAVGPSWLVGHIIRPMTRVLNPTSVKLAGRPGFRMAGRIYHVGRRTGADHVTPVGIKIRDGYAVIPLTFGNQSDWVRNYRAAGRATVEVRRRAYEIGAPEFLTRAEAGPYVRAAFPLARAGFRLLGIKLFVRAPVL